MSDRAMTGGRKADLAELRERWPLTLADQYRMNALLADAIVGVTPQLQDADRRAFHLAAGHVLGPAYHMAMVARVIAEAPGHPLVRSPIAEYLDGTGGGEPPPLEAARPSLAPPSFATLRRIARIASWCPAWRLPRALLAPEAVAISHNHLLRSEAIGRAIGFRQASSILERAPRREARIDATAESLAQRSAAALVGALALPSGIASRLGAAILAVARPRFAEAIATLERLRRIADLPSKIWSGSAGYWPSRAIGLEVLRRGGTVTRFDHGGALGVRREHTAAALTEFVGTSDMVLPTAPIAERFRRLGQTAADSPIPWPRAHGGRGDPTYRAALRPRAPARTRRVLYGTPPHVGARGMFPPIFPDAVGLELQMRLVRLLKSLPVELILRPHPEGLRGGRLNPLTALHPCAALPYEDLLPSADVLLFDHVATTTFTVALCTDRPIVMLDYGVKFFQDDIEALLDRRCARIAVSYDERNLPQVDRAELAAVLRDLPDRVDPEPFRSMFLGSFAV